MGDDEVKDFLEVIEVELEHQQRVQAFVNGQLPILLYLIKQ